MSVHRTSRRFVGNVWLVRHKTGVDLDSMPVNVIPRDTLPRSLSLLHGDDVYVYLIGILRADSNILMRIDQNKFSVPRRGICTQDARFIHRALIRKVKVGSVVLGM